MEAEFRQIIETLQDIKKILEPRKINISLKVPNGYSNNLVIEDYKKIQMYLRAAVGYSYI